MKSLTFSVIVANVSVLCILAKAASPSITVTSAQQRYPWNGKVDIAYTVSGDIAATAKEQGIITSLKVTATDRDTGTTYTATSLSGDTSLTDGTHGIVWDMNAQGLSFVSTNVAFTVSCETTPATYCVIDLSAGSSASSYPVTYMAEPPSGGFNTDEYKTTKLVLKRIEAGTFIMGEDQSDESHRVTLTKPFYTGLFEMTQKQYQLVTGNNPSNFSGDKLPVEQVSYNTIRGLSNGAEWPSSNAVDSSSFLGKLRARTGLDFDLPTEAQWEYACRSGSTASYSYGNSADGDYMWSGANSSSKTHEVGTKQPNPWGLYDMHGNVWEWCLDWYNSSLSYGIDPKGPSSGNNREIRGSCWKYNPAGCTSFRRLHCLPSNADTVLGFRLSRTLNSDLNVATLCSGTSAGTTIDLTSGTRTATFAEAVRYSTVWETSSAGATAVVAVDGETLSSVSGSGVVEWRPTHNGTYMLTHKVMNGGTQVGETLTATFVVHGPATPTFSPEGGVVDEWPLSVSISCATEGAKIHYTTDGSEPTADSPEYRRFRISERTTVKAVAIKDGVMGDTATVEYVAGQCADPVITPSDNTTFEHSGQSVSITWTGEDGVLRYTTDGSDPTAESQVYARPFTIDDSTVVKAKAFGDQFFDSAVVTASLTRVWVNVATPVVTAASSFTGSKTLVSLSCATDGAAIRYTLNGNTPNSHAIRYAGPFYVTDSCTVKAYAVCSDYLDSEVATFAIEKVWGIGDTLGVPDHSFTSGGDVPFFRVTDATAPLGEAMQSGAITHKQSSTMTTTVMGPGTVSFQWRTSCEEDPDGWYMWDHAEFEVDGVVVARLDGETAWQSVTHTIAGDGSHTLVWRYVKDDMESEGDDMCRVADYRWASDYTATQTTEVPVPYVWLRGYFPETVDEYDAYEAAAFATAANGRPVWECYVAGLDPTDADDEFVAQIEFVDGEPVVSVGGRGEREGRAYTVEGTADLMNPVWGPPDGNSRFFHVKVTLEE